MKKKKEVASPVDKPESPRYDFADGRRGAMCVLREQHTKRPRVIVLTEWPTSLLDAYRAGILTGDAEAEAKRLEPYHRFPHPWRAHPKSSTMRAMSVTNL